jgi:hypothetical protein
MGRMKNAVAKVMATSRPSHVVANQEMMITQGLMNIASKSAKRKINEMIVAAIQQGEQPHYEDLRLVAETAELTNKDVPTGLKAAKIKVMANTQEEPEDQPNNMLAITDNTDQTAVNATYTSNNPATIT